MPGGRWRGGPYKRGPYKRGITVDVFGRKKSNFFDNFDTVFDSRSDTSDDSNVREFGFVVDQHISDHFDDKTSGDECSVMGDNSAGIYRTNTNISY